MIIYVRPFRDSFLYIFISFFLVFAALHGRAGRPSTAGEAGGTAAFILALYCRGAFPLPSPRGAGWLWAGFALARRRRSWPALLVRPRWRCFRPPPGRALVAAPLVAWFAGVRPWLPRLRLLGVRAAPPPFA
jgi:hypothetical protein